MVGILAGLLGYLGAFLAGRALLGACCRFCAAVGPRDEDVAEAASGMEPFSWGGGAW